MNQKPSCPKLTGKDFLCLGAITVIVFLRFFRTIVLHKSISKLYLIALWDSMFYSKSSGESFNIDPSLVQQHLPQRFFIADLWHHAIPLWNAFSGFGMPLLADPQTFVFSPLFALFTLCPSMYCWNMTLITELLIGAVCTYLLCRELGLTYLGSSVASLLFTFCPYIDSQLELLGNGNCLIPFVFLFFMRAAKRRSIWSTILVGVASAILLLSAHPEAAFVTICFGVLILCLATYYNDSSNFKISSLIGRLLVSGVIAFGIAAPVLLPFVEYLGNCDSYKFAETPVGLPLQGIVTNYFFPFFKRGSLFWGPLSWWGIMALLRWTSTKPQNKRIVIPLLICLLTSIFAIAQLFPINLLFKCPPFSLLLIQYYVLPHYAFFLSIVSGLGIGYLAEQIASRSAVSRSKLLTMGLPPLAISLLLSPLICSVWGNANLNIPYSLMIEHPQFDWAHWLLNLTCGVGMLLALIASVGRTPHFKTAGILTFVGIGLFNLIFVAYAALPLRPNFEYPATLPINPKLANARFISIGDHLFKPDTYLVYQLPLLQVWNPLSPKGFGDLLKACGARVNQFEQFFPPTISRLLDVTGTRTIISQQPVLDEDAIQEAVKHQIWHQPVEFADALSLCNLELFKDPKAHTIFCHFTAKPHIVGHPGWHLYLDVKYLNGTQALYTAPQSISSLLGEQQITCSTTLPSSEKQFTVGFRLISDIDAERLRPQKVPFGCINPDGSWIIAKSGNLSAFTRINNDRFKLVSSHDGILSYENTTALDRQFLVNHIKWVTERPVILDFLKVHAKELGDLVVLEDAQKEEFEKLFSRLAPNAGGLQSIVFDKSGTLNVQRSPGTTSGSHIAQFTNLLLQVQASKPALLVVSDIYYPGWQAFLDGIECPIFRADYLFRAVLIPSGRHIVEFKYQPFSFALGVTLFVITFGTILVLSIYSGLQKRSSHMHPPLG
jgi:hypothetical protein